MKNKIKIIRVTTVPMSLLAFCTGMLQELAKKYEVIAISSPGHDLDLVAEREGVKVISVPMKRHVSFFNDLISLWRMWQVFLKEKPAMVHSMTPKAGLICMVAAWLARVPVRVHTFTGLVFPTAVGIKRKVLMATDMLTCACATHVLPEGEGVKNDLLSNGITRKPLQVLGYGNVRGVDMEYYSRRPEVMELAKKKRDDDVFTFVFVGRIVGDKGINELCEAFQRLNNQYPKTRCWLVGPFEDILDPINQLSREIIEECDNGLLAVGPKKGEELLSYYAAADCFVLPSYREGFPNTVLEAGAMGLPSVVTDINGSREIIENEVNGIIVPPKDVDALFKAMEKMLLDKVSRNKMASRARELIFSRFEQSFVRKCLYDFYDELLTNK